jgi:hypothetical protein
MTPDDMEGRSANLLADLGVLAATAREVPFDVWDRFANNVQQAAALLLDYHERGRALEAASPVVPVGREDIEIVAEWLEIAKETPKPLHSSLNYVPVCASEIEAIERILAALTGEDT